MPFDLAGGVSASMSWTPGVAVVSVVACAYRCRLDRIVIQLMINKRITPTIAPTIAPTMLAELCDPETGVGGDVDVDECAGKSVEVVAEALCLMLLAALVNVGRFVKSIEAALGSTDAAPLLT